MKQTIEQIFYKVRAELNNSDEIHNFNFNDIDEAIYYISKLINKFKELCINNNYDFNDYFAEFCPIEQAILNRDQHISIFTSSMNWARDFKNHIIAINDITGCEYLKAIDNEGQYV